MNERESLLKEIATYDFAIADLSLFLDTHPNSIRAQKKMEEYRGKSASLTKEYEEFFGPITKGVTTNQWQWISDPWPWNNEED